MLDFEDYIRIFVGSIALFIFFIVISGGKLKSSFILWIISLFIMYKARLSVVKRQIKSEVKKQKYFDKLYGNEEENENKR